MFNSINSCFKNDMPIKSGGWGKVKRPGFVAIKSASATADFGGDRSLALSKENTSCARPHGLSLPFVGSAKSDRSPGNTSLSVYCQLGRDATHGWSCNSPARFIAAKFSPFTHKRSIVPPLERPAAFSAKIRETALTVSVSLTWTRVISCRSNKVFPAQLI